MKTYLKAAAAAALVACGTANANLVSFVDLFDVPALPAAQTVEDTIVGSGVVNSQVGPAPLTSILGGYRELAIDLTASPAGSVFNGSLTVAAGILAFSNDANASSIGTVRWDGATFTARNNDGALAAINPTGLGGVFLGNVLTDSFALDILQSDGSFSFTISAYTDASNWSSVTIQAAQHATPVTSFIPLLAFLDCSNSIPPGPPAVTVACASGTNPVDFSNLGALEVTLVGATTNVDLSLNQVTVVPEPASIALAGLALLGAGVASRRRKTQA